jgi:allophanate hydrolase
MPLNGQLTERGAHLAATHRNRAHYRFYACPAPRRPSPACCAWPPAGRRIALEVWEMPVAHYGSFVALIPAPLGIGT